MSEIKEEKMPQTFWAALMFVCVEILMILVVVPNAWLDTAHAKEYEWTSTLMGEETAVWIRDRAEGWYDSMFVETKVESSIYNFFVPSEAERAKSKGFESLGNMWATFMGNRGAALHKVLQMFLERVGHLVVWLPFMVVVFVPSAWDGYMTWRIKRTNFDYASPFLNKHGHTLAVLGFMLVLVGIIVPAPIPPLIIPVICLLVLPVIGIWIIGNLPKRI